MKDITATLHGARRIALVSHRDPDPDTIGSALALGLGLESLGKHLNSAATTLGVESRERPSRHGTTLPKTGPRGQDHTSDGATAENPDRVVDRRTRAAVCNGTAATNVVINGTPVTVIGTQNLNYTITDGKGNLIIEPGFNVSIPASGIVITNPRVDDTEHSQRLLATSGRVRVCGPGESEPVYDSTLPGANPAGAFLAGSAPTAAPGNRIQVQFTQTGRYLAICMNRGHLLNDHMFGFVNVVGEGNEGK